MELPQLVVVVVVLVVLVVYLLMELLHLQKEVLDYHRQLVGLQKFIQKEEEVQEIAG